MKQPKLNIRLIRRIQKHILEEPRRFFMGANLAQGTPDAGYWRDVFRGSPMAPDLPPTVPPCGTAACIAGWTGLLLGKTPKQINNLSFEWFANKLGIGKRAPACNYFYVFIASAWPRPFKQQYHEATTPQQRAEIAVKRLDHLITTGQ